jgi:hypothetical protein
MRQSSPNGIVPADGAVPGQPDPVFVLCMGRSGSTLLRFLLDAHPDLACPPETSMPALCGQLAVVWSLIEGAPLSQTRGDSPPVVPDAAIAGIRHMMDMMTAPYLTRRSKKRFCEKSLGSARFADLLMRVYPDTKFICLYRHPMDVIRSGLDACPWGLNGYGFDQYIGGSPGNAVLALARYWLDNAAQIAAIEEEHPDRCFRIRYEDLVTEPEDAALEIYSFIGVDPMPGVAQECFNTGRERFGPADHKIWATSKITANSVGSGESVPAGLIPPPITFAINELTDKLGYIQIDEGWGTPGRPADPRLPDTVTLAHEAAFAASRDADDESTVANDVLEKALLTALIRIDDRFACQWETCMADRFVIVSRAAANRSEQRWLVDMAARIAWSDADADDGEWTILGSPQAWQAVLIGRTNLQAALRRCDLRYCSADDDGPLDVQTRMAMLADLLGLSSWRQADTAGDGRAGHAAAAVR